MNRPEESPQAQQRLIVDFRLAIENAEELLKNTDQYTSLLYQGARAKLTMALTAANEELAYFEDAQLERMIVATHQAGLVHPDQSGEARVLRAFY